MKLTRSLLAALVIGAGLFVAPPSPEPDAPPAPAAASAEPTATAPAPVVHRA